jgi:hypothetical protein
MSYGTDDFLSLATSPNFTSGFDWPNTSATAFSPSDLPLSSQFNEFGQSISHSGDSAYQSVPGLTSNSSLTHESENEPYPEYWTDNIAVRHTPSAEERWLTSDVPTLHLAASLMKTGSNVSRATEPLKLSQPRHSSSSSAGTTVNVGGSPGGDSDTAHAIVIPAGSDAFDDTGDWSWDNEYTTTQQPNDVTRDLNWLF